MCDRGGLLLASVDYHLSRPYRDILGVGAWLAGLLLFFVIFNPEEVLLYASVPVALIIYSIGVVLGHEKGLHIAEHPRRMVSTIALATAAALLLGLNHRPIWGIGPGPF